MTGIIAVRVRRLDGVAGIVGLRFAKPTYGCSGTLPASEPAAGPILH